MAVLAVLADLADLAVLVAVLAVLAVLVAVLADQWPIGGRSGRWWPIVADGDRSHCMDVAVRGSTLKEKISQIPDSKLHIKELLHILEEKIRAKQIIELSVRLYN